MLAKRHGATIGCPLTTGIFAWIAAQAAEDDFKAKQKDATPYWRTLKSGGYLNEKYPGGISAQKTSSRRRGTRSSEGQRLEVADFDQSFVGSRQA